MAECVGVDYEDLYGGGSAKADSPTFVSPQDEQISNSVAVAPDEAWMTSAMDVLSGTGFRKCMASEVQQTMEDAAAEADDGSKLGDVTVNEISFDSFGDDSMALRVTIPVETEGFSLEVHSDFVVVRVGRARTVVNSYSTGSPVDPVTLAKYTKMSVDRQTTSLDQQAQDVVRGSSWAVQTSLARSQSWESRSPNRSHPDSRGAREGRGIECRGRASRVRRLA